MEGWKLEEKIRTGGLGTLDENSKNRYRSLGSFETGGKGAGPEKKKGRRVSPRRELAVVTLGAVAAITGLGGFLAANPPSWALAPETATQETASEAATPAEPAEGTWQSEADADSTPTGVESTPVQEEWAEAPPPAWSAPPREPAATESRGS